jgi:uncharacterized NAD(P)/FAD-binding protein YdhS
MNLQKDVSIAIIGAGPTGMSALESLLSECASARTNIAPHVVLFDPNRNLGSGPNFAPNQSSANVLNIAERLLDLDTRPRFNIGSTAIPGFPSYWNWASVDKSARVDNFPPRAKLGAYLRARLHSVTGPLIEKEMLCVVNEAVERVSWNNGRASLETPTGHIRLSQRWHWTCFLLE